jgi:hypothetical protein
MIYLIPLVFGLWGGAYGVRYTDEEGWYRNPRGCKVCALIIGAVSAIIIDMLAGPQIADGGFFARAVLDFGGAVAGVATVGALLGMAGVGKAARA